jgi:hypothetical protein
MACGSDGIGRFGSLTGSASFLDVTYGVSLDLEVLGHERGYGPELDLLDTDIVVDELVDVGGDDGPLDVHKSEGGCRCTETWCS